MRGKPNPQSAMLVLRTAEQRIASDHPIRRIKSLADAALAQLSSVFEQMYSKVGRDSIPPERLLKASLLIALYSIRSERMFCERLDHDLLFQWFLDMNLDEPSFEHSSFTKNRERLLRHDVAGQFFSAVVGQAKREGLVSSEHFSVDGTLIEAWASLKSFKPKDTPKDGPPPDDPGNPTVDFHGETRSNQTHQSTTDPDALLARKSNGTTARLSYCANALMENRNGLLMDILMETADGRAERRSALAMIDRSVPGEKQITVGGDRGYDTREFIEELRARNVTPHVAQNQTRRRSNIDARTTRHPGYRESERKRKRIEEIWGWMKSIGGFRRTRFRGIQKTQFAAYLVGAAYNLLRMAKLQVA